MKSTITTITEAQIENLVDLFVNKNMVTFEREDIAPVIAGKKCVMLEAVQEEEGNEEFFRLIGNALNDIDEARDCQTMLVYFEVPDDENLSVLNEMGNFQCFSMDVSLDADIIWGEAPCRTGDCMKVTVVVAQ